MNLKTLLELADLVLGPAQNAEPLLRTDWGYGCRLVLDEETKNYHFRGAIPKPLATKQYTSFASGLIAFREWIRELPKNQQKAYLPALRKDMRSFVLAEPCEKTGDDALHKIRITRLKKTRQYRSA